MTFLFSPNKLVPQSKVNVPHLTTNAPHFIMPKNKKLDIQVNDMSQNFQANIL